MNRIDLAVALTNNTDLTVKTADVIVRTFIEAIAEALIKGDRVEILDFGALNNRRYGCSFLLSRSCFINKTLCRGCWLRFSCIDQNVR